MSFGSFVLTNIWIIGFYLALILIIIINRKKFEFQAKIIAVYKTNFGIAFMERFANKYKEWLRIFGYMAMGIGFAGMIAISILILKGLFDLFFVPGAAATISPFIPGVQIPGSPIHPPFWESIIALFIVIVIHECSHGVVARVYNLKIKNTGFVLFGPLPGAFVEPDEKKMEKESDVVKHSIFGAGPFSNIVTAILVLVLLSLFFVPIQGKSIDAFYPKGMTTTDGITFTNIKEDSPAKLAGLQKNVVYTQLNGEPFKDVNEFTWLFVRIKPNDTMTLTSAEGTITTVQTGTNPDNSKSAYLGVDLATSFVVKQDTGFYYTVFRILAWIGKLLFWIFVISLGLGLANLLPIGPVDGGRMLHTALVTALGQEKGTKYWSRISYIVLIILIPLLVLPILRAIL